jgi:hypothetical protein
LQDVDRLKAAIKQILSRPYKEEEIMLLRVIGEEFGKKADAAFLREFLTWYDAAPDGMGKAQFTSLLLELQNKEALDFVANKIVAERSTVASTDSSLLYHSAKVLVENDPDTYFLPVIDAASKAGPTEKESIMEGFFESGGFDYNRSMVILEGESPYSNDPRIVEAAVYGLANQGDERAKDYLLGIFRDENSPQQEAAFESLRMMQSNTPGIFTAAERAEFMETPPPQEEPEQE